MARKKAEVNTEVTSSDSVVSDLISGTSFEFVSKDNSVSGSLTDKPYVPTPILALNDLLGGGFPLGSLIEVFGPNASGKSSMMYETLGNFQRKFPNGVAFIVDTESSTDADRLAQLGVDSSRLGRCGAATLEDGFSQIVTILTKMTSDSRYNGFPVFIMWDTIANSGIKSQIEEGADYNRMVAMERARILKFNLTKLFPLIEKLNVLVVLLNQATVDMSGWHPGITSSGGNALLHNIHLRIQMTGSKTEYDGVFAVEKSSKLSLLKSKISPIINNIPVTIDITQGGIINKGKSLVDWFDDLGVFNTGAWYSVNETYYNKYKPYWDKFDGFYPKFRKDLRYSYAENSSDFRDFLQLMWLDMICEKYTLQAQVCNPLREEIKDRLWTNLGLTEHDFLALPEATEEVAVDDMIEETEV